VERRATRGLHCTHDRPLVAFWPTDRRSAVRRDAVILVRAAPSKTSRSPLQRSPVYVSISPRARMRSSRGEVPHLHITFYTQVSTLSTRPRRRAFPACHDHAWQAATGTRRNFEAFHGTVRAARSSLVRFVHLVPDARIMAATVDELDVIDPDTTEAQAAARSLSLHVTVGLRMGICFRASFRRRDGHALRAGWNICVSGGESSVYSADVVQKSYFAHMVLYACINPNTLVHGNILP
jgi:hypothetical protein